MVNTYINFVIKTTKGRLFGGYTDQIWKDDNRAIRDENAFVFSIDKKKKYSIKQPECAIGLNKKRYLIFGWDNNAIGIVNNYTRDNLNYVDGGTYDIKE